jgi:diguanylate cyclase (GGDEF)-like protein/PAS domain S-box-containing protein
MSDFIAMSETIKTTENRKKVAYVATFMVICVSYYLLRDQPWQASLDLLVSTELAANILSLCVGALALVRYYSQKDITFVFIGTGFVINGLLGCMHAVVTYYHFMGSLPSFSITDIAWSWYASRLFLPVLLWLSWVFWKRAQGRVEGRGASDNLVYWIVGLIALSLFSTLDLISQQDIISPDLSFSRFKEYLPAIFLLLSLTGYYRKGKWKTDPFEHWLILAIMVNLMGETLLMPFSQQNYDTVFSVAHILNITFYVFTFIGLLTSIHRLFSESLTHQQLKLKNTILSTQQETSLDAILVVDENAKIISYNRRFVELWRVPAEMVRQRVDKPVLDWNTNQVQDPDSFMARVKYLYEHKSEKSHEELNLKDGRIIDRYSAPMIGEDGTYYGRIWYFRDITDKRHDEQEIQESEVRFRSLVDQSLMGIAMIEDGKFSYVNRKLSEIFGHSVDEIMRMGPLDMAVDVDKKIIAGTLEGQFKSASDGTEFTFQGRRKNGALVNIEGHATRMHFRGKSVMILILLDITERIRHQMEVHKLQAQLLEQAIRDPLTGLYNRRYLDESISRELFRAERNDYPISVVMCDIDHFKTINDTYGHFAGDEVLRVFSDLLKHHSRSGDIVCRYGGEEFILVLPGMEEKSAYERAEQLRSAFANIAMPFNDTVVRATASFGVATFNHDEQSGEQLIAAADKALYMAKHEGRNKVTSFAA